MLNASLNRLTPQTWTVPTRSYGIAGNTALEMLAYMQANFANVTATCHKVIINLGVNDITDTTNGQSFSETTYKNSLRGIIDLVRAKWPSAQVYIARVWRRDYDAECDLIAGWIADVVAEYPSGVYVGMDERVWLENGDDGTTYTSDGIHYTAGAQSVAAAAWVTAMGL